MKYVASNLIVNHWSRSDNPLLYSKFDSGWRWQQLMCCVVGLTTKSHHSHIPRVAALNHHFRITIRHERCFLSSSSFVRRHTSGPIALVKGTTVTVELVDMPLCMAGQNNEPVFLKYYCYYCSMMMAPLEYKTMLHRPSQFLIGSKRIFDWISCC